MLALGEFGDPDAFAGWILGRVTGILQEQSKPLTVEPSMPAFRGKNFRSGDLAEQLGLLLLQSLALVAPVPRTEDIGIDAVVTLLEDFDKYRFKASNSFYVQLKSTSVTSIAYMNDEVDWLFALELPFFVAEVDRTLNRIKLYCCHALHEAFVVNPRRARLCLEFENGICEGDFVSAGETIHIGPPICSWSMDDIETKEDLRAQFNAICKAHIQAAKTSMELRRVGRVETVVWRENELPEVRGWKSMFPDEPDRLERTGDLAVPYLVPFLDLCVQHEDDYWLSEILRLTQERRLLLFLQKAQRHNPPGTALTIPEEFRSIIERQEADRRLAESLLETSGSEEAEEE